MEARGLLTGQLARPVLVESCYQCHSAKAEKLKGVLYLDTQLTARELAQSGEMTAKFNEDHLRLAIAVSHQAALAVEETRYHHAMLQGERLAAIGQTIAALSHHIKNIMQGLRSGSDPMGGNKFAGSQYDAPIAERDPIERIRHVQRFVKDTRAEPALDQRIKRQAAAFAAVVGAHDERHVLD